jgi:hypothetical protein
MNVFYHSIFISLSNSIIEITPPSQPHHPVEQGKLAGVIDEEGHDGQVERAVGDEAEFVQAGV